MSCGEIPKTLLLLPLLLPLLLLLLPLLLPLLLLVTAIGSLKLFTEMQ